MNVHVIQPTSAPSWAARLAGIAILGVGLLAVAPPMPAHAQATPDYAAILAAPGRSDADLTNDKRRDPVKLLAFAGVHPGMKALDMGAGAGYSSDIIARAVGQTGMVYAQNAPDFAERVKARLEARIAALPAKNIVLDPRPFDDPLPADAKNLDLVTFFFFYHDTTAMAVDRAKMNRALFAALKPGGSLVIADHAANTGDGANVGKTLHRIEKATVIQEIEAAGFKLADEGTFLRHPEDPHTESVNQRKQDIDEFILRFEKPRS
jgi:predicted methyltransferase